MIQNYIFDIDGTMIDSKNLFYESLHLALQENKIDVDFSQEALFSLAAKDALKKLGVSDVEAVLSAWGKYFNQLSQSAPFFDGIIETIHELHMRNKKIAIVTSRDRTVTAPFCSNSVIGPYISLCVAAEDTEKHKPNPDPILFALEKLNLDAGETVYIGDTQNDFLAATNAGIGFVAAGWNENARKLQCFQIDHPEKLLDL